LKNVYFDSAYLVKCYIQDKDSKKIVTLVQSVETVYSSALCIAEVSCALHRAVREKIVTQAHSADLRRMFSEDLSSGIIQLIPVSNTILKSVETTTAGLPSSIFLRAGDAIHLASAQSAGFSEIWSNDRHMLLAASHFGIVGKSVA
jgi:predicted nucleic acid-binding protein